MNQSRVPGILGKFIHVEGERFLIKGVSYGTFAPDHENSQFPPLDQIAADFRAMRAHGINTIRTYDSPPARLLDEAARQNLKVIVGLSWAQHVAFLDDARLRRRIRKELTQHLKTISDHPAVLLTALGNEIPVAVVRWHGASRVERFLRELYDEAKTVAPDGILTYVNYPPTEYLDLPFLDVCAFNVYLHRETDLRVYLTHLQHIAGNRPLLLTELGADSIRESEEGQAALTSMQLRAAFAEGASGAVVFTWTDDWWRGGEKVDGWAFGLVDAERHPKLALPAVSRVFADAPFADDHRQRWPTVSVVVCAYNAQQTLEDCLSSLAALTYPRFEVLLVNDGSDDATKAIADRFSFVKVVDIPRSGLSHARNVGVAHATGEIVAFTDADVRADPDWLTYLVQPFLTSNVVGSGGTNVVPPDDPWVAQCIARSPGGPTHVLLDDRIAEHVPGCNMAFRRDALMALGGFNPIYVRAGDDVDLCWRFQKIGRQIGFAPAALVWHHHRPSARAYWRQQVGYGEAESWLLAHHPDKFLDGRMRWQGRIYSSLPFVRSISAAQIHAGIWGTAPFPSVYQADSSSAAFLPHLARWQAVSFLLLILGILIARRPLGLILMGAGLVGFTATAVKCFTYALRTNVNSIPRLRGCPTAVSWMVLRIAIAWFHAIQPLARGWGRLRGTIIPPSNIEADEAARWHDHFALPSWTHVGRAVLLMAGGGLRAEYWSDHWVDRTNILQALTARLREGGAARLVEIDNGWQTGWDVRVGIGRWAYLPLRALVEDHGSGKCLLRVAGRLSITRFAIAALWLFAMALGGAMLARVPYSREFALALVMVTLLVASRRIALCARDAWRSIEAAATEAGMGALDRLRTDTTSRAHTASSPGVSMLSFRSGKRGRRMAQSIMPLPARRTRTAGPDRFVAKLASQIVAPGRPEVVPRLGSPWDTPARRNVGGTGNVDGSAKHEKGRAES